MLTALLSKIDFSTTIPSHTGVWKNVRESSQHVFPSIRVSEEGENREKKELEKGKHKSYIVWATWEDRVPASE